jgi:alanine dehydrogenase
MTAPSMSRLATVPNTSTPALASAKFALHTQHRQPGWRKAVQANHALAEGVSVADGRVVYQSVADGHGLAFPRSPRCSTHAAP